MKNVKNVLFSLLTTLSLNLFAADELTIEKAYQILGVPIGANFYQVMRAYNKILISRCKSNIGKNRTCTKSNCKNYKNQLYNCNNKKPECIVCKNAPEILKKTDAAYYFLIKNKFQDVIELRAEPHTVYYNLKLVEDRFVVYHKISAIELLKHDLKEIEHIKNDLKKEDPTLNDFSEFASYTNELRLALSYLEHDQFLKAKEVLSNLYKQYSDIDFNDVQEHLKQILDFKTVLEIAIHNDL